MFFKQDCYLKYQGSNDFLIFASALSKLFLILDVTRFDDTSNFNF